MLENGKKMQNRRGILYRPKFKGDKYIGQQKNNYKNGKGIYYLQMEI